MVVYDLICEDGHKFEGWFKSSDEFQQQLTDAQLMCPSCESKNVRKLPTASYVSTAKNTRKIKTVKVPDEQKILEVLKAQIINNAEDVGSKFAEEAKKIHYGEVPAKNIRGTASKEEVADLTEEGVSIISLPPILDKKKLN